MIKRFRRPFSFFLNLNSFLKNIKIKIIIVLLSRDHLMYEHKIKNDEYMRKTEDLHKQ